MSSEKPHEHAAGSSDGHSLNIGLLLYAALLMHICLLINFACCVTGIAGCVLWKWSVYQLSFPQAEELDLPEILKKKEEITETRNALFQEISHEKDQYVCLDVYKEHSYS